MDFVDFKSNIKKLTHLKGTADTRTFPPGVRCTPNFWSVTFTVPPGVRSTTSATLLEKKQNE